MPKSKEQKRKEAIERNKTKYFDHLFFLLKMLPDGEYYKEGDLTYESKKKLILKEIALLQKLAIEYHINFDGTPYTNTLDTAWTERTPEYLLTWELTGKPLKRFRDSFFKRNNL